MFMRFSEVFKGFGQHVFLSILYMLLYVYGFLLFVGRMGFLNPPEWFTDIGANFIFFFLMIVVLERGDGPHSARKMYGFDPTTPPRRRGPDIS